MTTTEDRSRKENSLHLIVTDSGLGGLAICAGLERTLRRAGKYESVRITYFNAWPNELRGYNDLPDMQSRARVFDRALERMAQFQPDGILIACNTLSIIYDLTCFRRSPVVPVLGIIDAGVDLFYEALRSCPATSIVLLGTTTTIESGVHRERLTQKGIHPRRITAVACPGLAAAIERDPGGVTAMDLIEKFAFEASAAQTFGRVLYCGFCCTHYTYVTDHIRSALERHSGKTVHTLDPKDRIVSHVAGNRAETVGDTARCPVTVDVFSKVKLDDNKRRTMAEVIRPLSTATASALLSYNHAPGLF